MEFDLSTIATALSNNANRSVDDSVLLKIGKVNIKNRLKSGFCLPTFAKDDILAGISTLTDGEAKVELLKKFNAVENSVPERIKKAADDFFSGE